MLRNSLCLLVLLVAVLPVSLVCADSGCLVAGCHAEIGQAAHVHAPVADRDCAVCHVASGPAHPGEGSFTLVEAGPALCLQCHDNPLEGLATPHPAAVESCIDCHNPHQSEYASLVLEPEGALCLQCHDSIVEGKYVHGPVAANNCKMCHRVHGSEHESMLKLPENGLCLACHTGIKEIMENAVSQHEPVVAGRCWDCHTPHAADNKPFLKAYYPRPFYVPFEAEHFALCFNCHDKNAFVYERTTEATQFRNRDANLHFFHVNRPDKGRVCKSCHGVHGADQGKLLMSKVPGFGRWEIPLRWEANENGATCYVGCHRPKSYDRNEKIDNL